MDWSIFRDCLCWILHFNWASNYNTSVWWEVLSHFSPWRQLWTCTWGQEFWWPAEAHSYSWLCSKISGVTAECVCTECDTKRLQLSTRHVKWIHQHVVTEEDHLRTIWPSTRCLRDAFVCEDLPEDTHAQTRCSYRAGPRQKQTKRLPWGHLGTP